MESLALVGHARSKSAPQAESELISSESGPRVMHFALRSTLPPLPRHMQSLPVDSRGYPVPFFVEWINGVPDFRVASLGKMHRCVLLKLCWICGKPLGAGRPAAFIVGPPCAITRVSSEPPSHTDCAEFAVRTCPFMVMPKARRREGNLPSNTDPPPDITIERHPGVMLVWLTPGWTVEHEPHGYLFRLGRPVNALWYCEGRAARRNEVLAAIESGLPSLRQYMAAEELDKAYAAAMKLIPERRQTSP